MILSLFLFGISLNVQGDPKSKERNHNLKGILFASSLNFCIDIVFLLLNTYLFQTIIKRKNNYLEND